METAKAFFTPKPPLLTELCPNCCHIWNHFARGDEMGAGNTERGVKEWCKQQSLQVSPCHVAYMYLPWTVKNMVYGNRSAFLLE
ncbi:hypothetical protein CEXT_811631 [Caerostris extrusa]|uniref:Uncharacterized protein n=1 Tax=Caerostris extrusa TaxID=172846 RepID=A0AAV4WUK9_CAEEX|nr:hypothetical protein CEXT_811631 [Caerostris extrusa]